MTKIKSHSSTESIHEVLEESLWLNQNFTMNGKQLYWDSWVSKGILRIGHILDKHCNFLSHTKLSDLYGIKCNFLDTLKIRQNLPFEWKQIINNACDKTVNKSDTNLSIILNDKRVYIEKVKCKDYYWHLISQNKHVPTSKYTWEKIYPEFQTADSNIWSRIYTLAFSCTRETLLQSFQYKIIHRVIACNKWLYDIKIKNSNQCKFCKNEDNIQHFFLKCTNTSMFWTFWKNWWKRLTGVDVSGSKHLEQCLLFGFPGEDNFVIGLNYCVLVAKYFIYIKKLSDNNDFDFYSYLTLLKNRLVMEDYASSNKNDMLSFILSEL